MKNWEKAVGYAQKAYSGVIFYPALRERIEKAGFTLAVPGKTEGATSAVPAPAN